MLLTDTIKITKVADYASADTADVEGSSVDMAANGGWDGVIFVTSYGTAAANNLMHAEQSSDDAVADAFADIAGSEIDATGASDEDQVVDIFRPQERYVRPVAARGTSSTLEGIWAIQYRGKSMPASNTTSGTIVTKRLVNPIAGTK